MGVARRPLVVEFEHEELAICGELYEQEARPLLHTAAAEASPYLFLVREGKEMHGGVRRWDRPIATVTNGPSQVVLSATRVLLGEEIG